MIIFNQNRKCEQNVTIIVLMKTMCVTLKKHWIHISVHRNSRRKTLCYYLLHNLGVSLFYKKIIKFPDFVKCQISTKIVNFHEMCDHHLLKSGWYTPEKHQV